MEIQDLLGVCGETSRWYINAQTVSRLHYFCWQDSMSAVFREKEMQMWLW